MMTLRCTRKLMAHFGEGPAEAETPPGPPPLLGEWYANLVQYGHTPMALCVNEKSRYAIVVPLEECKSLFILYVHLAQRICDAMRRLGIPDDVARRVLDEHRGGVRIAPTDNRSVLGTMNDLSKHLEWHLDQRLQHGPIRDPADLEEDLNTIPHKPLGWFNAGERFIELCGGTGTCNSTRTVRRAAPPRPAQPDASSGKLAVPPPDGGPGAAGSPPGCPPTPGPA